MSKSMMSRFVVCLAAAALVLFIASAANASLTVNLRLADGTTSKALSSADANTDIVVNVWATVIGPTQTTGTDEGLTQLYYSVKSGSVLGGVLDGTSDILAAQLPAPFNWGVGGAGTGQAGLLQDMAPLDGITDIGSTATAADTKFCRPSVGTNPAVMGSSTDPTLTKNLLTNGVEFLIEQLTFHVGNLIAANGDGATTTLTPIRAPFTTLALAATWKEDNLTKTATTTTYLMGSAVSFTLVPLVPEPATMAFLAMGGLSMVGMGLRRFRRGSKA